MPINELFKERIQHVANLPTLPQVASRLISIIDDPLTSSSEVASIVGQDLSFSAKILRLANSAFYGIPKSITNLNNAVVLLGLKVINTMVLSITVFDLFNDSQKDGELFNRKAFWLHSLGCGLIAKFLTQKIRKFVLFDPEEAFCAGLLHDIGKVVMEQYIHDEFHTALSVAFQNKISIFSAEEQYLGYTHADAAEWLTSSWGLPGELQFPMIYHHIPSETPKCHDIVALIHLADRLCYDCGITIHRNYKKPDLDNSIDDFLKLTDKDIQEIKVRIPQEMETSSIFFDISS